MRPTFTLLFLFSLFAQAAYAADDEASLHNIIRNALSFGSTVDNLGPRLDQCYEYSKQNRPATPLPPLSNSSSLRSSAASVASLCVFAHSQLPGVGENLFVGTTIATTWTLENAINDWADEARLMKYVYDPAGDYVNCVDGTSGEGCRSEIGHYTQMMWADTQQVGCAIQVCPNGVTNFSTKPSQLIVCHYGPQGNYFNGTDYLAPYVGQGVQSPTNSCTAPTPTPTPVGFPLIPILQLLLD